MLRTRPDLHYAPVPGGVYFSGARAQFVLRGSEVLHAVAQGCVPLLENGTDEDALVAGIGTERARPAVRLLVDRLRENGLLLDPAAHTAPEPSPEVRRAHAESLARLEGLLDDPYGAFARLRAATVLVTGPETAVGPAARGLRRAGIGTVLTAPDPDRTPDAVLDIREDAPAPGARGTRTDREDREGGAPAALVVPVRLGGSGVTLVGPAVTADGPDTATAFRDRARAWAAADGTAPAPRPVADALAGALGAQLLVDALTGTAAPGEAHVVHGTDLVCDRVTVEGAHQAAAPGRPGSLSAAARPTDQETTGTVIGDGASVRQTASVRPTGADASVRPMGGDPAGPVRASASARPTGDGTTVPVPPTGDAVPVPAQGDGPGLHTLAAAPADPRPEPDEAREAAAPLGARWTGPVALGEGADLPQMPLALRAATPRTTTGGATTTVLAWAAHQETATVAACLAALRTLIPGAPTPAAGPHAHIPGAPTPAAGLTREHWLLDGALRLLARETEPLATTVTPHVPPAALPAGAPAGAAGGGACAAPDPEGLRVLAGLRTLLADEPAVRLLAVPGLDWRLAEVTADGAVLGRGWGADAAEAARTALCTALARTQTTGADGTVDPLSTDALLFADRAALDALRAQLAARPGTGYRGEATRYDPVLGELPFWYGPVEAHDAH
ncbi:MULTISPECIES: hypothetical protein [unclassified Streptomyces]|uniref:hypothetical protein n=1 Tax=unclassified Streptomyces TaxID=2593676 RepID=UPI0037F6C5C5